jgi:hypothetical protein
MTLDDVVHAIPSLSARGAADLLAELDAALASGSELTAEQGIAAAYIAGIEDALTNTAGRPEYDLRRLEATRLAKGSLSDTGRAIGAETIGDIIAEARSDVG